MCPGCGKIIYYDPKVVATSVVERGAMVLIVKRAMEPGLGLWSLPGGYVDRGEAVEQAAQREVKEETGLDVKVTGLVGIFSEPGYPVILVAYDSQVLGGELQPGPEVMELGFFSPEKLPPLAFTRDVQVLKDWRRHRDGCC